MSTKRIPRARVSTKHRPIRRRASRRKSRQLPHILKHVTFIAVCTSILLLILASVFHSSTLTFDAIVIFVGCIVIDGIALALQ